MLPSALLLLAMPAHAATITVGPSTTSDHTTIADALHGAVFGDIIEVAAGTYTECLWLQGRSVTIRGVDGADATVLDCAGGASEAILADMGETLELEGITVLNPGRRGLRFVGGELRASEVVLSGVGGAEGGALVVDGSVVTIEKSVFDHNIADEGGAIHASGPAFLSLVDVSFEDNFGAVAGGAVFLDHDGAGAPSVLLDRVTFARNETLGAGGALFGGPGAVLSSMDTTWESNVALDAGGAVLMDRGASVMVMDDTFESNVAGSEGGAIGVHAPVGFTLSGGTYRDNLAAHGGALWLADAPGAVLDGVELVDNNAWETGGGVELEGGDLTVTNGTWHHNWSLNGGGLLAEDADVVMTGLVMTSNIAEYYGGDLFSDQGGMQLSGCQSSGSEASSGAFLYLGRFADGSLGAGEGVDQPVILDDVSVTGARTHVLAALVSQDRPVIIENSQFVGNHGEKSSAVRIHRASASVRSSAFRFNHSVDEGAALYVGEGAGLELRNSVFEDNTGRYTQSLYVTDVDGVAIADTSFHHEAGNRYPGVVLAEFGVGRIERSRFHSGTAGSSGLMQVFGHDAPTELTIEASLFEFPRANGYGMLALGENLDLTVSHTTFLGDGNSQMAVELRSVPAARFDHVVVSGVRTGLNPIWDSVMTVSYSAFYDNETDATVALDGPGLVFDDPLLSDLSDAHGRPLAVPMAGSPLIDAGDAASGTEADGSAPDIGWTGGPTAGALDLDGDGYIRNDDCDDALASTHPGAPDEAGDGIDSDCDGEDGVVEDVVDETPSDESGGADDEPCPEDKSAMSCSTAGGAPVGSAAALVLGLVVAARRRHHKGAAVVDGRSGGS